MNNYYAKLLEFYEYNIFPFVLFFVPSSVPHSKPPFIHDFLFLLKSSRNTSHHPTLNPSLNSPLYPSLILPLSIPCPSYKSSIDSSFYSSFHPSFHLLLCISSISLSLCPSLFLTFSLSIPPPVSHLSLSHSLPLLSIYPSPSAASVPCST